MPFLLILGPVLVASAVVAGVAGPTGSDIVYGANGPALGGSSGAPVVLGFRALLAPCRGPDGNTTSADDRVLLVTGVGGTPVTTSLATPYIPGFSGHLTRLSATSAVFACAGTTHGTWGTADDAVHLMTGLGSLNLVTTIPVGFLSNNDASTPQRLTSTSIVFAGRGTNGTADNADDEILIVTDLGGANTVAHLPAPRLPATGRSRPVVLSPTAFLVASDGPDGSGGTVDDVTYLFRDAGSGFVRTDLATPNLYSGSGAPSRPVRLSATRALVSVEGADSSFQTVDDAVLLLDHLDGTPVITPIVVGALFDYGAGQAAALGPDLAVIASLGPDAVEDSPDDGVVVISGIGTTNTTTAVALGTMDEDFECRPVALDSTTCAVVAFGADDSQTTADDEVVVLSGVGTTNTVTRVVLPGLAGQGTSRIEPLSGSSFLVMTGGTTNPSISAGGDSAVALVTGLPANPLVQYVLTGGDTTSSSEAGYAPAAMGGGRAVHQVPGADGALATGTDDAIRILSGLSEDRGLSVSSLTIGFKAPLVAKKPSGEKVSLKAFLATGDDLALDGEDLTISIGNASQTIPAGSLVLKKRKWTYADKKGVAGFVTSLTYDPVKGTIAVKGKGLDTGLETTSALYVPVAVERGESLIGDSVAGTRFKGGIKYKPSN